MNEPNGNSLPQEQLDCWAIVELMGHQKIAGKIKIVSLAGAAMLRVDVPKVNEQDEYTRFFSSGAIYSINPVSEAIATGMVSACRSDPVKQWDLPKQIAYSPEATPPDMSDPEEYDPLF